MPWFAVAVGGALGALARYGSVRLLTVWLGPAFPYGTLVVNVLGSGIAGWLFARMVESGGGSDSMRALLIVGFLGAFTTFSAFSVETLRLAQAGHTGIAVLNVLLNIVLCLGAAALGMGLGRAVAG
ncbi:fluoride efflux transporter CrcB [Sinimarinibacterium thermocellulolyticum]|uniref:Fluoride-specific ion channel FluC n=1 Tax=Sinimarinibacterium thermocellulolyticum TaxID=3170016 RepID=A0ABV2AAX4_9GAMM